MSAERGPSGTGHDTAGWVGLQHPTRVAHAPEPDPAADPVVSPADTRQRVMYLLDALCQDSLELPLSHVDDPFTDSHISSMFKELRDLVAALLAVGERDRQQIARLTAAYCDPKMWRETWLDNGASVWEFLCAADCDEPWNPIAVLAGEEDVPRTRTEVGFAECGDAVELAEGFAAFWHHDKTSDRLALAEWLSQLHDEVRNVLYVRAAGEGDT